MGLVGVGYPSYRVSGSSHHLTDEFTEGPSVYHRPSSRYDQQQAMTIETAAVRHTLHTDSARFGPGSTTAILRRLTSDSGHFDIINSSSPCRWYYDNNTQYCSTRLQCITMCESQLTVHGSFTDICILYITTEQAAGLECHVSPLVLSEHHRCCTKLHRRCFCITHQL